MNNTIPMKHTMVILMTISILMLLIGCKTNNVPAESMDPTQNGETKTFSYDGLKLEVTNVYEVRTESMNDDGGNSLEYSVFVCYTSATVTVISADMSDSNLSADGKSHPNWGVLLASGERKDIVDNMDSFPITPDMLGIYNLESSMYVLKFENKND
ncbi:hypothetical protein PA598K_00420 [Paenibacillus sp. 598K]|uniref:hypothetical protein n=1 Tax=Paenibacillus sp. 598K TaxID=1117987 RepID=UPI000FFAD5FE|nr:hypothetical protein [Paenibacillus sp. 598K]GBF72183.1 hypothetical protein PA598K_00420 [Paenibacillus sp. 598K]